MTSAQEIERLWRHRPRGRFVRWSLGALVAFALYAWFRADVFTGGLVSAQRAENLRRFVRELRPFPLQGHAFDLGVAVRWAVDLLTDRGLAAAATTLAISIVAISIAGIAGSFLALPAARTLATAEPYGPAPMPPSCLRRWSWALLATVVRAALIFLRSIPEYLWAFLLVALLGPVTWAAVLALAIHNTGILGKLDAEVLENLEPGPMRALRALGAGRSQIAALSAVPLVLPRWLLFFFYRWETCVREATVIGLLGIASLGAFIQDARARQQYDVMVLLILVGAAIVVVGDLVSGIARAVLRRGAWR